MESPGAQLRARLGPNTPDILVSNTTILKDDDQVVDRVQNARKQTFQDLLYDSAQTMAYHLASQDDPTAALCPNEIKDEEPLRYCGGEGITSVETFDPAITPHSADDVALAASHLSCEIMGALRTLLNEHSQSPEDPLSPLPSQPIYPGHALQYVNRSLFYGLSNPDVLLRSFRESSWSTVQTSPLPHLDPSTLEHTFRAWYSRNQSLIFNSLCAALECLFVPPRRVKLNRNLQAEASRGSKRPEAWSLKDRDAAHIIMICVHALTSFVSKNWPGTWMPLRRMRGRDRTYPDVDFARETVGGDTSHVRRWTRVVDELEDPLALRLATKLVRAVAARRCHSEILRSTGENMFDKYKPDFRMQFPLMNLLMEHLQEVEKDARKRQATFEHPELELEHPPADPGWTVSSVLLDWLRTIVLKNWDGKAEVKRWEPVGAAIEFMAHLYKHRQSLGLNTEMFCMPFLADRLDIVKTPNEFFNRKKFDPNTLHLLSYPYLFVPSQLVWYFRTRNYCIMEEAYSEASYGRNFMERMSFVEDGTDDPRITYLSHRLKAAMALYLVLDVRRSEVLRDALDQLWGREKRELLRPLKVRMGASEGEEGVDHGGVSQEFFQVALAEAFDPDHGLFTVDPTTRMTWFQPASLEPLYKFELIGLLFSLAIYNGITLPVTFPLAFYKLILHEPIDSIDDIRDGWPELAKGLEALLSWDDGDVGDVFSRTYEFSFETYGQKVHVDMTSFARKDPWPARSTEHKPSWSRNHPAPPPDGSISPTTLAASASPVAEAPLVTNANRHQYVADYIHWLTEKSILPQFCAFRGGLAALIDSNALSLLDAPALRHLIEGTQTLDTRALEAVTLYADGYDAAHPTIRAFWEVVHAWPQARQRQLLEFVTASERVPVNGVGSIRFEICRIGESEMLPQAATCFGKLLLPEYPSKEVLERKLGVAVGECRGFGSL
ncbi:hypothetical protein H2199_006004 [Coniosporium tulheliwenetii]|uniref:Uncharacterized protein n=1 Tax=Coniosporium tulheliwenetii TaxID=3383036 RepID=A0ACC2YYX2_9PEZI|nr:hypothetical protein H2199_006004 [Cladosporium sp. JES 115]